MHSNLLKEHGTRACSASLALANWLIYQHTPSNTAACSNDKNGSAEITHAAHAVNSNDVQNSLQALRSIPLHVAAMPQCHVQEGGGCHTLVSVLFVYEPSVGLMVRGQKQASWHGTAACMHSRLLCMWCSGNFNTVMQNAREHGRRQGRDVPHACSVRHRASPQTAT